MLRHAGCSTSGCSTSASTAHTVWSVVNGRMRPQDIYMHAACSNDKLTPRKAMTRTGDTVLLPPKPPAHLYQHGTAQHGTARHGTARHGTAQSRLPGAEPRSCCRRLCPAALRRPTARTP